MFESFYQKIEQEYVLISLIPEIFIHTQNVF